MTTSASVRSALVTALRRDLVGPLPVDVEPGDADLQRERLAELPSHWYLTGFLAPLEEYLKSAGDDPQAQEEAETDTADEDEEPADPQDGRGPAPDDDAPDAPVVRRRLIPSSIGLTVLVPATVETVRVRVTWGDYVTEPPLPETVLAAEDSPDAQAPKVHWIRHPRESLVILKVPRLGKGSPVIVPDSAAIQKPRGALQLQAHARPFDISDPDRGVIKCRALSVFLVNSRTTVQHKYADISYAFQARLEVICDRGLIARRDLSGYHAEDEDMRTADLHYRHEAELAVGRNTAAGWDPPDEAGLIRRAWTEPLPTAEVERVAPNDAITHVTFGMEDLAALAETGGSAVADGLQALPTQYAAWVVAQRGLLAGLAPRRRETGERLIVGMETARDRIAAGIDLLRADGQARQAFRIMNLAIARAMRHRWAGADKDPKDAPAPRWRPFQLAFILLNLPGLADKTHEDREIVDLLFFPTGGGKTEAYLGLTAFTIAWRRMQAGGLLGAGVTTIMRYTLRLLTLDQLSRAAGVICALELMRTDTAFLTSAGRPLLGDWPIEIGLWVGSAATPNVLGGRNNAGDHTAVSRVRKYKKDGKNPPAPIKTCPWCGTPFDRSSFTCTPNERAPTNLTITCANALCDFTGDRPLPILTVDETIYRRLPAFLIATVDKFAGLPWLGPAGAFFGHVDRHDAAGFYGAAEPYAGVPLPQGRQLPPPDLIIQDELHLISGPLGTVAGLYETAIDHLAARTIGERRVRPKVVASTATVRRAKSQIKALFDRDDTQIFPPPGIERVDSWFAKTLPPDESPARLYLGLAAQGRGPKLVFLRGLTTLMSAGQAAFIAEGGTAVTDNPADPYMTALCYFNALRELGGARRIVEDEVRTRVGRYGSDRHRVDPPTKAFVDRTVGDPLELTSRVSTEEVASAKDRLEKVFRSGSEKLWVDVALATNMISVGLDIGRLGLMLVQGQPKTAAEYIQSTSRVGRVPDKPGLVVTVLNLHKPRDRTHYESFHLYHRTFYRAVEATSVTPWAARALDRSLAAVVVSIARHIRPDLTPERAVQSLKDFPDCRAEVLGTLLSRAPANLVVGGHAALQAAVDRLLDDWKDIADELAPHLVYGDKRAGNQQLLHMPLDPALDNLTSDAHRRFTAARSMRDVEASVVLRVRDPYGGPFRAEDVQ